MFYLVSLLKEPAIADRDWLIASRACRTLRSSPTTSLTDSFKSRCVCRTASDKTLALWAEEEAGDGRRGPDAGAAGAAAADATSGAAADAASGATRAAGVAAAGAPAGACLIPCPALLLMGCSSAPINV